MAPFDPSSVDLATTDPRDIICFLNKSAAEYDQGHLRERLSAIFVLLFASTLTVLFPVVAIRSQWIRIPTHIYLFARYFGAGVIIATAFIHLLDPAYKTIGPNTCISMTSHWSSFPWVPTIVMGTIFLLFLLEFTTERWVEHKYDYTHANTKVHIESVLIHNTRSTILEDLNAAHRRLYSADLELQSHTKTLISSPVANTNSPDISTRILAVPGPASPNNRDRSPSSATAGGKSNKSAVSVNADPIFRPFKRTSIHAPSFKGQLTSFIFLELSILLHSILIGLNLGASPTWHHFKTLYPVLTIHQAFEGLGLGARLSSLPFPRKFRFLPWIFAVIYGVATPAAVGAGIGIRSIYTGTSRVSGGWQEGGWTEGVVCGVLDAISAGVLIWTGLVELLAREFLFNGELTRERGRLGFMIFCVCLGMGGMAGLGKWA